VHCDKAQPPKMCPELADEITQQVAKSTSAGRWVFKDIGDLYPSYRFTELASHSAVVVVPYGMFTFALAELYALGIPMFVPTPAFLVSLCQGSLPCHVNGSKIPQTGGDVSDIEQGRGVLT